MRRKLGKSDAAREPGSPGNHVSPPGTSAGSPPACAGARPRLSPPRHHLEPPPRASYLPAARAEGCTALALPARQGHACRHFLRGGPFYRHFRKQTTRTATLRNLRDGSDFLPMGMAEEGAELRLGTGRGRRTREGGPEKEVKEGGASEGGYIKEKKAGGRRGSEVSKLLVFCRCTVQPSLSGS